MSGQRERSASFEELPDARARVTGSLGFSSVGALLAEGDAAIRGGRASVIDLAGVTDSDSSALALLIEWLSVAKEAHHPLRYENMPSQLRQLARLSDVEELLMPRTEGAAST